MTRPYQCFTAAKFVKQWLAEFPHQLERDYKERFLDLGFSIEQSFRQATQRL